MSFIPIGDNRFVNTKNIDFVTQDIIDGKVVMNIISSGAKVPIQEQFLQDVINIVRNQDKEEGNWVGR